MKGQNGDFRMHGQTESLLDPCMLQVQLSGNNIFHQHLTSLFCLPYPCQNKFCTDGVADWNFQLYLDPSEWVINY